uniref:Uncharacterized protein n=1 Tax=Rhizophora mucronata TaxID=61149 RepID=A0A2P2QPU8_RHIMU
MCNTHQTAWIQTQVYKFINKIFPCQKTYTFSFTGQRSIMA